MKRDAEQMMTANQHKAGVLYLYKVILRLHKGLPEELQALGTAYVRDEFRRHKTCDPETAVTFMTEWTLYAKTMAEQMSVKGIKKGFNLGRPLTEADLNSLRDEQIAQLYELHKATKPSR